MYRRATLVKQRPCFLSPDVARTHEFSRHSFCCYHLLVGWWKVMYDFFSLLSWLCAKIYKKTLLPLFNNNHHVAPRFITSHTAWGKFSIIFFLLPHHQRGCDDEGTENTTKRNGMLKERSQKYKGRKKWKAHHLTKPACRAWESIKKHKISKWEFLRSKH